MGGVITDIKRGWKETIVGSITKKDNYIRPVRIGTYSPYYFLAKDAL